MTVDLIVIGKTNIDFVTSGVELYTKRLSKYIRFSIVTLQDVKNAKSLTADQLKIAEGEKLLEAVSGYDYIVFLDERGKEYTSMGFAELLQSRANMSTRKVCFVVGGAYGFSTAAYGVAHHKMSISKMTFSHQMIRLLFTEQLYRAYSIIAGEPYHHE